MPSTALHDLVAKYERVPLEHDLFSRPAIVSTLLPTATVDQFQLSHDPSCTANVEGKDDVEESILELVSQRYKNNQRWFSMALLAMTTILLFSDQNLMAPNLTAIANDFGFSDDERDRKLGGDIALAFYLLGTPASFFVGCLADTHHRMRLFAVTVIIGESACVLTYVTNTYWQLYACRAVTGFSLGGALPLIYSILGDLYSADERHQVNAIVGMGTGMGIAFGQGIAGFLGPTYGWRLPFLVVGIPAILCALVVYVAIDDPERGGMEEAARNSVASNNQPITDTDVCNKRFEDQHSENYQLALDDQSITVTDAHGNRRKRKHSENNQLIQYVHYMIDNDVHLSTTRHQRSELVDIINAPIDARNIMQSSIDVSFAICRCCPQFGSLFATPTVLLALLQGAPGCVPWGVINTFLSDFLAQDRGMSVRVSKRNSSN
jgi:hypothetical protein